MKRIILFLMLISFNLFSQSELPFDFMYLTGNINGFITNESSIIAYGEHGILLYSSDNGKQWEQKTLSNYIDIKKIILYNNQYYGFGNFNNKIFKSLNKGKSWEISNVSNDTLLDIAINREKLFLLSKNKLFSSDLNFNLNNKSILSLNENFNATELLIANNNIFIPISMGRIIKYNIDSNKIDTINFKNFNLCDSCSKPINLKFNDNKLYVVLNDTLLVSDNYGQNWKSVAYPNGNYEIRNDEVYSLNYFVPTFDKADIVFSKCNNNYKNQQMSLNIKKRFISDYRFTQFTFINDNIILAVGKNKLIAISNNAGLDWEIISYINSNNLYRKYFVNQNLGYLISNSDFSIYKTSNGGITWKPQLVNPKFNKLKVNISDLNVNFDDYGNGLIFNQSFGIYEEPNILITKDFGETYEFIIDSTLSYSNTGTEKEFIKSKGNLFLWQTDRFQNNCYTLFYFFKDSKALPKVYYDSVQFVKIFKDKDDNLFAITHVKRNGTNVLDSFGINYYEVLKSIDGAKTWIKLKTIKQNTDFIREFLYKDNIMMVEDYGQPTTFKLDSLGNMTTVSQGYSLDSLYLYNINSGNKNKIFYTNRNSIFENYYLYNQKLYLFGKDAIYENSNFDINPNEWKTFKGIINTNLHLFYFEENKAAYFDNFGGLFNSIIKLTPKDSLSSVDSQTEEKTYFYSYPPFPVPAMNEMKSLIYWDMSYNIDDSDIGVYDIYGNKIANREKISINKLNAYSGYLTWDCSGIATGVYLIQIKHGTNTHNIRAMVAR